MRINPAPFSANFFLYSYEEEYMLSFISSDKIQAIRFHSTKRFIDDLCHINKSEKLGKFIYDTYSKDLEVKIEHQGGHATFLKLNITIMKKKSFYISCLIKQTPCENVSYTKKYPSKYFLFNN